MEAEGNQNLPPELLQHFSTRKTLVDAIRLWQGQQRKQIEIDAKSGATVVAKCIDPNCNFHVTVKRKIHSNLESWRIEMPWNLMHILMCVKTANIPVKILAPLLKFSGRKESGPALLRSAQEAGYTCGSQTPTAKAVAYDYNKAARLRRAIMKLEEGDFQEKIKKLHPLLLKYKELNPGMCI